MKLTEQKQALACAVKAAKAAGRLMRHNLGAAKRINSSTQFDIKLELDVRSQKLIERILHQGFPKVAVLGEEGDAGDINAAARWVVDPIDGTVNYAYGIPHACVSIALQVQSPRSKVQSHKKTGEVPAEANYQTVVGVVYDPFCEELWTAIRGQPARLNGKIIHVSRRKELEDCIVAIGFAKSSGSLERSLPYFNQLVRRVRKVRMNGVAALGLTYVATGRFDGYVERGIRLWDIAAGGLIIECAGGEFWHEPVAGIHAYRMVASNGQLRKKLLSLDKSGASAEFFGIS
jgi:myo-inositol-1(or 4)-monophosphatase